MHGPNVALDGGCRWAGTNGQRDTTKQRHGRGSGADSTHDSFRTRAREPSWNKLVFAGLEPLGLFEGGKMASLARRRVKENGKRTSVILIWRDDRRGPQPRVSDVAGRVPWIVNARRIRKGAACASSLRIGRWSRYRRVHRAELAQASRRRQRRRRDSRHRHDRELFSRTARPTQTRNEQDPSRPRSVRGTEIGSADGERRREPDPEL